MEQINEQDLDEDQSKVKKWVEKEVKIKGLSLFKILIQSGFEDLDTVKELNEQTLKQMGVNKVGHRIKILKKVKELNENEANAD